MGFWKQTWVKKHNRLQAGVFVVIDLDILKGSDQLVQHPIGHTADLHFTAVAVNNVVVAYK